MKRLVLVVLFGVTQSISALGQCAMCRSTLENNISNGNVGIAAGINTGILYLLSLPYLAVILLACFWYKHSRKEAVRVPRGTAG